MRPSESSTAVVIGGTSRSVMGTVIGCLINGLFLLDVSPFWQQVIKGLVIIVAGALDRVGAPQAGAG